MSLLVKDIQLEGTKQDIYIEGGTIRKIGRGLVKKADEVLDGQGMFALRPFVNAHSHAAMTLLRGYADDLPLDEWLNTKIWPVEANLQEEDVYWGVRLACIEMIRSGTTLFNDMYWHFHGTCRAVEDSGIRAAVSAVFIDLFDNGKAKEQIAANERLWEESKQYSDRILFTLGPHAIYTVSEESLRWVAGFANEYGLRIHIHLSETKKEVADSLGRFQARPVDYLDHIGFLGPNVIAAHGIWVNESEMLTLRDRGVKVVYNPTSNMKLASGVYPFNKYKRNGITTLLGTDGCASNNNLDMLEEMKIAALLQKISQNDPALLSAEEVYKMGVMDNAAAFGMDYGKIKPGTAADLILIDPDHIGLVPHHQFLPNLIYAASGNCVDTTICDGKVLMLHRSIQGEAEVIAKAKETAEKITA